MCSDCPCGSGTNDFRGDSRERDDAIADRDEPGSPGLCLDAVPATDVRRMRDDNVIADRNQLVDLDLGGLPQTHHLREVFTRLGQIALLSAPMARELSHTKFGAKSLKAASKFPP